MRLIDILLPSADVPALRDALEDGSILDSWRDELPDGKTRITVLVPIEKAESFLDVLETRIGKLASSRIVILAVEASLPRPSPPEEETTPPAKDRAPSRMRISREELYADVEATTRLSSTFITLVVLSSTVAAIGLLRNDVAILIGAMVIAPLLGPNVALSLATTLGDLELAKRALRVNAAGLTTALAFSFAVGIVFAFDPSIGALDARTRVGTGDIVLALASGAAGALAFTSGAPAPLVGVMVAVALLPPLVALGMLLGAGETALARGAALLVGANVICLNLAGVAVFLIQGVRPRSWCEKERARRATWTALVLWTLLLVLLLGVILTSKKLQPEGTLGP